MPDIIKIQNCERSIRLINTQIAVCDENERMFKKLGAPKYIIDDNRRHRKSLENRANALAFKMARLTATAEPERI